MSSSFFFILLNLIQKTAFILVASPLLMSDLLAPGTRVAGPGIPKEWKEGPGQCLPLASCRETGSQRQGEHSVELKGTGREGKELQ